MALPVRPLYGTAFFSSTNPHRSSGDSYCRAGSQRSLLLWERKEIQEVLFVMKYSSVLEILIWLLILVAALSLTPLPEMIAKWLR